MLKDEFRYAAKFLTHRKLRSWLTMLGIFIGIAAVVALVSLSQGLQVAIQEQFEKIGSDKIIISPKGSLSAGLESDVTQLTLRDKKRVEDIPSIDEVAVYLTGTGRLSLDDENVPVFIGTLPSDKTRDLVREFYTTEIEQGRTFRKGEAKIIIGDDFVRTRVLERELRLGDKILLNDVQFEVIGVMERIGDPGIDGGVLMDETQFRDLFDTDEDNAGTLIARVESTANIDLVAERIERSLRNGRGLDAGKEDFDVQTPEELIATFNVIFLIVQAVLIGIAAISLLVGGIGITNTMYTAVLERTNEIGVMKAIGARNEDVLKLFLFESGLLGLIGGAIGVALGMGIAKMVEILAAQAFGTPLIQAFFPSYLIIGSLAFAFVVGVASGVLPAYQAAKLQPVEALRYE